jgi:hypothetical protein
VAAILRDGARVAKDGATRENGLSWHAPR